MFGWFNAAWSSASCRKRVTRCGSVATASGSTLIATWRFRLVSLARYTSPMPPAPICAVISYTPRRVPGAERHGVLLQVNSQQRAAS